MAKEAGWAARRRTKAAVQCAGPVSRRNRDGAAGERTDEREERAQVVANSVRRQPRLKARIASQGAACRHLTSKPTSRFKSQRRMEIPSSRFLAQSTVDADAHGPFHRVR